MLAVASASIHGLGGAVIAGPAGAIHASVAPGAIALGHGGIWGAGLGAGLWGGHGLLAPGSGLEGQWIPDINEKLHDDGSYKPWIYGH